MKYLPKLLIPLTNTAFILSLINNLTDNGYDRIIISVGYNNHVFQKLLNTMRFDAEIIFLCEDYPLSTGGAIKLAGQYIESESVMILNGDIFSSLQYENLRKNHNSGDCYATLTVKKVKNPQQYGLVLSDNSDSITDFSEKPQTGLFMR